MSDEPENVDTSRRSLVKHLGLGATGAAAVASLPAPAWGGRSFGEVFNESISKTKAEIYFRAFARFPIDDVTAAIDQYAASGKFFPRVSISDTTPWRNSPTGPIEPARARARARARTRTRAQR